MNNIPSESFNNQLVRNSNRAKRYNLAVLYVENEPDVLEAVAESIRRRFSAIYLADNGVKGLEMFNKFRPDIVFTDIKMPLMDGLTMIRQIKAVQADIPIVIITAHEEKEFFMQAIELGINNYIMKPVDGMLLKNIIDKLAKAIENEKKIKYQLNCIEYLMNLQKDPCFYMEENKISSANKPFLSFFGFKTIEELRKKYEYFTDFAFDQQFKVDGIYISPENISNLEISSLSGRTIQIKPVSKESESRFILFTTEIKESEKLLIFLKKKGE